jgi:methylmalonyl-CoA/ethylmalonyl-CoA epimerase
MTHVPPTARPIHHVAVAVFSIEKSRGLYELLAGESCSPPETLEDQGVRVAFVGSVELLEPLGPDTTVGRFLELRGPGLHHVAYGSENIEADLASLEAAGVELIDRVPRAGARGHRVAFLRPDTGSGVLIELVERRQR